MDGKWGATPRAPEAAKCHRPPAASFRYTARVPIFFFWVGRDVTCLDARLRVVVCVTAQTYWERRDIHKTLYAMHLVSLSLL